MKTRLKVALIGLAVVLCAGILLFPLFVRARESTRRTGGEVARRLSAKNRELAGQFQDALKRKDITAAEAILKEWRALPGTFGENSGYWMCMRRLREAQNRPLDVLDAYRHIDSYPSTLQTSSGFLSGWAVAAARADRMGEVPAIYKRLASSDAFQKDAALRSLPLAVLSHDPQGVYAVHEILNGHSLVGRGYSKKAQEHYRKAIEYHPELASSPAVPRGVVQG